MIIKKKEFAYSKKTRDQWPFTVPEVAVIAVKIQDKPEQYGFALVHNWGLYALTGTLQDQFKITPLEMSGVWASSQNYPELKKSLTPFFKHLEKRLQEAKR